MLPGDLLQALQDHLRRARQQHEADLKSGPGQAPLPVGLKQESKFWDMPEAVVNTMVAGPAHRRNVVLGRPGAVLSRSA